MGGNNFVVAIEIFSPFSLYILKEEAN